MTDQTSAPDPPYRLLNYAGSAGQPFSGDDLPGLIAKGRKLGLSDEVLAIQLQLTPEELIRVDEGDQASLAAVVPAWHQRIRRHKRPKYRVVALQR
jgi:hypothetical protein